MVNGLDGFFSTTQTSDIKADLSRQRAISATSRMGMRIPIPRREGEDMYVHGERSMSIRGIESSRYRIHC
jgi:hypothetical protein